MNNLKIYSFITLVVLFYSIPLNSSSNLNLDIAIINKIFHLLADATRYTRENKEFLSTKSYNTAMNLIKNEFKKGKILNISSNCHLSKISGNVGSTYISEGEHVLMLSCTEKLKLPVLFIFTYKSDNPSVNTIDSYIELFERSKSNQFHGSLQIT